ncbi:amidohydrolase family protein [Pelagicoccus sp. SDUM812003]|uniref:amidohydrolase family protein n=1 Tax=Pelagicoccus sp. SDUM812003 TaxID=3041267 RepID=UPI00280F7876|nr:amidohydrolase family protein [Pelagicoccus sp. SDUM812003]MDQ8201949.1 amidohydrolase family protein [Pelagicoccus sp. SDUM812003]
MLPGLIESHAHLFLEGAELDFEKRKAYLKQSPTMLLAKAILRLEKLLKLGITAYRDAGDKDGVGIALSKLYRSPSHPAMPYVESPGPAIHHRGRYGSFMAEPIEDHAHPASVVEHRIKLGADRIKLIPTGIINFKKGLVTAKPQMDAQEVKAFTEAAKERGKQTFAHASGSDGIQNAIDGGVDSVEHGFFITDEQLARMRDLDIAWTPTFAPVQVQVDEAERMGWDQTVVSHLRRILESHSRSLAKAQARGVKIVAGSDAGSCGVGHGTHFLSELELMEQAGLSPLQVINSATGVPASRLGFSERFGSLTAGCKPRFILTEHDPLACVSQLRLPKITHFDGREFVGSESDDISGL